MDKEFHYWITGIIADKAGFTNAETGTIAYSSQFVDDNDVDIAVYADEFDPTPSYRNQVSQTINILLPRKQLMTIYPSFHFIPGDQGDAAKRKDGKTHPLNTTPDSSYAKLILQNALDAATGYFNGTDVQGLFRLGIATHAFADTWAHQNFAGSWDEFNDMGKNITPDVGHADALHHPDWVAHRWDDHRLADPMVSNNSRYIAAARRIYYTYAEFLQSIDRNTSNIDGDWKTLEGILLGIFGTTSSGDSEQGSEHRIKQYRQLVPFLAEYRDNAWQNAALRVKTAPKPGTDVYEERYIWLAGKDKTKTEWYLFQESVKAHAEAAENILQHVYALAGVSC
jgi:hypothetical protein